MSSYRYSSPDSPEGSISHITSCLAAHEEAELWTVNPFMLLNTVDTFMWVFSMHVHLTG